MCRGQKKSHSAAIWSYRLPYTVVFLSERCCWIDVDRSMNYCHYQHLAPPCLSISHLRQDFDFWHHSSHIANVRVSEYLYPCTFLHISNTSHYTCWLIFYRACIDCTLWIGIECLQREGFKELTGVSGSRVSPNLVERSSTRSLCSNTTPGTVSPEKASGDAPGLFRICPPLTHAVTRNSRLSGGAE